ncbi:MAG: Zn-dependent protease with chaperone function [Halioglobus sp.]|jgi:Zn-dependent protease with chaperone function
MDFFAQQDIARRNTRLLTLLFAIAVFGLILLTNAAFAAFLYFNQDYNIYNGSREGAAGFLSYFTWARFGTIGLGVTATVAMVSLVKWIQLSSGGKAVAEGMGGSRILPQTRDRAERRCLNVVEEMALAANMPVPAVYVMNDERGINAFAAGTVPADAVVAVTRGAIVHLKRHELQGVVAHEFSHILNGDMRLNVRLAAMLKGITFVGDVGEFLMYSGRHRSGNSKGSAGLPMLGLGLWLLGWLGGLTAGFIKAAISRQKEFLADASAVQYTRSSDGIGDALKVIGGYVPGTLVHAARATEVSHIFFGQIEHRLWQVFATHPPLADRISKIDPQWNGEYIERKTQHYEQEPSRPGFGEVGVGRAALVAAAAAAALAEDLDQETPPDADFEDATDQLDQQTALREAIPVALVKHSHEPLGAHALVYSLLIDGDDAVRATQLGLIRTSNIIGLEEMVFTLSPAVHALGAPHRLPLLEMCLPALKSISAKQYRNFKNTLLSLVQANKRTELHEWCLFQLVRHYLDPEFVQVKPSRPRFRHLKKVARSIRVVLSVLAHEDGQDPAVAFTLGVQALDLPTMTLMPREEASVAAFSKAVHELADCYPLLKPRVLKAMALVAASDEELSPQEREIIASIAAVMDCPLPYALDATTT